MGNRILVVDDERHIVRLIQINLERSGYEVITAFDGQEALQKMDEIWPDLIISDVMMPKMDGFELRRRLSTDPMTSGIPFIFLSARAQDMDLYSGLKSGALAYLTKPFNPVALLECVKGILNNESVDRESAVA